MRKETGTIIYSPSDLIRYLASPFGSWLDRYRLEGLGEIKPDEQTEEEKLLSRTGDEHEQSVLKRYKAAGTGLIEIPKDDEQIRRRTRCDAGGNQEEGADHLSSGACGTVTLPAMPIS